MSVTVLIYKLWQSFTMLWASELVSLQLEWSNAQSSGQFVSEGCAKSAVNYGPLPRVVTVRDTFWNSRMPQASSVLFCHLLCHLLLYLNQLRFQDMRSWISSYSNRPLKK